MSSDKCGASRFLRHCYYSLLLLSVTVLLRVTAFAPPASTVTRTITTCLHVSDSSKNDPLTTAKRERRDEDVRRNDRKAEVVPGKTSAIPGAKDYPLNPAATTEEWMKHASKEEQQVYRYTEEGMNALKMFQLKKATASFDQVFILRPNAYLWQAGIPEYYLGQYVKGATIMSQCAALAESKFGLPASEERIWRDACYIQYKRKTPAVMGRKSKDEDTDWESTFPEIPAVTDGGTPETRKVIQLATELFAATIKDDSVSVVLARAKLRAIGTPTSTSSSTSVVVDRKLWKLTSWFYLGLHYDALGNIEESKHCLKQALRLCPNANGDDIIQALPMLHMSIRDWFDDDDFFSEVDNDNVNVDVDIDLNQQQQQQAAVRTPSQVMVTSIQQSVKEMKLNQLQDALKLRGLKFHGLKEDLQRKLVVTLCADLGLEPFLEEEQQQE